MTVTPIEITVNHGGTAYKGQYMSIEDTELGYTTEFGSLGFTLFCENREGGVRVDSLTLDARPSTPGEGRVPTASGLAQIAEVLRIAERKTWESLKGAVVLVLFDDVDRIHGIANPKTGDIFVFTDFAAKFKKTHTPQGV